MAKKSDKQKAINIQKYIASEFGFDISAYKPGELRILMQDLKRLLDLDIDTENLKPVDEYEPLGDSDD